MITDYYCRGILQKIVTTTPLTDKLASMAIRVVSQLPSGSAERLDFLGTIPALREWEGKRTAAQPTEFNFTIKNRKFETGAKLPLDWINNDKTGNVALAATQIAQRYAQWPGKMVADLLNNGTTGSGYYLAYDNQAFFSASHVFGQTSYSNIVTYAIGAGPSLVTAYEMAKATVKAIQQILGFLDDRGEPLNEDITDLTLAVPIVAGSQMAGVAFQAINLPKLDTGSGSVDNPLFGYKVGGFNLNLVVSPRLTGTAPALINTSGNAMPFIFQENLGDRLLSLKGPGSDFAHDQDAWEYGMKAVGNAGYGRPTDAVQIQFS